MAYIFPSDAGTTCVGISLPKAEFPVVRADPDGELERRLAVHACLVERLRRSEVLGRTEGGPPEASRIRQAAASGGRSSETPGSTGSMDRPRDGHGRNACSVRCRRNRRLARRQDGRGRALASYRQQRDEHASAAFEETTRLARDLSVLG
jgi:hypothetical protein